MQSDQILLNYVIDTYNSYIPVVKIMHLALEYLRPHWYPEGWKQDPDGLYSDLSEDNLGGEAEEALVQNTGTPRKGSNAEKGEPKTVREAQRWFSDLQVLKQLMRYKDPLLQPVRTTQILLSRYGLGYVFKGGSGIVLSMTK